MKFESKVREYVIAALKFCYVSFIFMNAACVVFDANTIHKFVLLIKDFNKNGFYTFAILLSISLYNGTFRRGILNIFKFVKGNNIK